MCCVGDMGRLSDGSALSLYSKTEKHMFPYSYNYTIYFL